MHINVMTILLAALSNFILGALWYSSILFGTLWQTQQSITKEQMKSRGAWPFIFAFIYGIIAAIGFNYLVMNSISLLHNITIGLIVGVTLVATSLGVNYQFAARSNKLFLIDSGYHVVRFILYALIFWYLP